MKIMENLFNENLISLLISPITDWLFIIKIVFIFFSLLLLVGIFLFLARSSWLKFIILFDVVEFFTFRPFGLKKIEKDWRKIVVRLDTGLESEYKLAALEADNMMNDILKRMGYTGETLGERLKNLTSATLPNIEEIREAHQIRNNIIHDPDYRLSLDEARKMMEIYEKGFRDLQAF